MIDEDMLTFALALRAMGLPVPKIAAIDDRHREERGQGVDHGPEVAERAGAH
ncbi:hypothetical protein [Nonomuraea sp. NPDC050786]|uniref:hypothetical protein n=1 Tax=Nonomuraea sp. NPDC050786 TaxID=3154840 RepID=UPI003410B3B6